MFFGKKSLYFVILKNQVLAHLSPHLKSGPISVVTAVPRSVGIQPPLCLLGFPSMDSLASFPT